MKDVQIRFLDYSMKLSQFFKTIIMIAVTMILTQKYGAVFATGLIFFFFGAAGSLLCALFWLCDEGPTMSTPVYNTALSVCTLIGGIILLLL